MITLPRLLVAAFLLALGGSVMSASTASVNTPPSSAGTYNAPITVNDLKPAACSGIAITHVQTGQGVIIGIGNRNELILGGPEVNTIDGKLGDDCILGGGGDDDITGAQGTDVCIGGGQAGDTFTQCETVVP